MLRKQGRNVRGFTLALIVIILCGVMWPMLVQAAPPSLPPRPTPTPTPMPASAGSSNIMLRVHSNGAYDLTSLWTLVEWQHIDGTWRSVDGWKGTFDTVENVVGHKIWSVPFSLFGKGPFRWQVYDVQSGMPLATSEAFDLPAKADLTLTVDVTLGEMPAIPLLPMSGGIGLSVSGLVAGLLLLCGGMMLVMRRRST